jgi:FAD synthetase
MPRVLVFGTFDGLHPGHRFVLDEAAKRGDVSVVVARDANVERIKGYLPQYPENQRVELLKEAYPDMHILLGDPSDFLAPVRGIEPDLILLGYDQRLPPGVQESDLPSTIERLPAFEPEKYKSSFLLEDRRKKKKE